MLYCVWFNSKSPKEGGVEFPVALFLSKYKLHIHYSQSYTSRGCGYFLLCETVRWTMDMYFDIMLQRYYCINNWSLIILFQSQIFIWTTISEHPNKQADCYKQARWSDNALFSISKLKNKQTEIFHYLHCT